MRLNLYHPSIQFKNQIQEYSNVRGMKTKGIHISHRHGNSEWMNDVDIKLLEAFHDEENAFNDERIEDMFLDNCDFMKP